MDNKEILIREYETITHQIIHWDKFFWEKSQFFLAVESALLAGAILELRKLFKLPSPIRASDLTILLVVVIFNLFLCYVWFRTSRSNREYLRVRFQRALRIESDPRLRGVLQLYHEQDNMLAQPQFRKHSSSKWELHIPSAFGIAWVGLLLAASLHRANYFNAGIGVTATGLVVVAVILIERTGWPTPTRGWLPQTQTRSPRRRRQGRRIR